MSHSSLALKKKKKVAFTVYPQISKPVNEVGSTTAWTCLFDLPFLDSFLLLSCNVPVAQSEMGVALGMRIGVEAGLEGWEEAEGGLNSL